MYKAAIIVCSDKCYHGMRTDTSGKAIEEILTLGGYEVTECVIVPDEDETISETLRHYVSDKIPLIFTTGGTGFSPRDVTPEATRVVIEREAPGIAEAMRSYSLQITPNAMLSRGIAGIADRSLIINLPGSEKAVRENLTYILPALSHGVKILLGDTSECGRK